MSNAFTKTYLTELIDSRIKYLNEAPETALLSDDEKLLKKMRVENVVVYAETIAEQGSLALEQLEQVLGWYREDPSPRNLAHLDKAGEAMGRLRGQSPYGYGDTQPVEARIVKARSKRSADPAGEISRLERVKNYITDSPADEFSLTLMRSLGFIDIIKNAINN